MESQTQSRVFMCMQCGICTTSCPFCVMNLEDPATEKGLSVKELSEIVMEAL